MKIIDEINNHLQLNCKVYLTKEILEQEVEFFKNDKRGYFEKIDIIEKKYKENYGKKKEALEIKEVGEHITWAKSLSKQIGQYDLETNKLLATHESVYAASQFVGKKTGFSNISRVAHGKSKSAYGYIWKFE